MPSTNILPSDLSLATKATPQAIAMSPLRGCRASHFQPLALSFLAAFLAAACLLPGCNPTPRELPPIEVCFSPHGGCTEAIVKEIEAAKKTVLVQAFSFTSREIARALVKAHGRGVNVRVIIDDKESREEFSLAESLHDGKVPVLTDALHDHAHNKVIILDDAVVITGSFNFTHQAEHGNAENLLVIRDRAIAGQYKETGSGTPRTAGPGHCKGRGRANPIIGCINTPRLSHLAFPSPTR